MIVCQLFLWPLPLISAILSMVDAANATYCSPLWSARKLHREEQSEQGFLSGLTENEMTVWVSRGEGWPDALCLESDCPDSNLASALSISWPGTSYITCYAPFHLCKRVINNLCTYHSGEIMQMKPSKVYKTHVPEPGTWEALSKSTWCSG